jgi:hypothetical protein
MVCMINAGYTGKVRCCAVLSVNAAGRPAGWPAAQLRTSAMHSQHTNRKMPGDAGLHMSFLLRQPTQRG